MSLTKAYHIGVLSDTHNRLHPRVPELLAGVDEIWHLGDVCHAPLLAQLELICPQVLVVQGNNDDTLDFPLHLELQRAGEDFYLMHIPPRQAPVTRGWLLCGHTHVPLDELRGGVRWFNPGSAGLANKGAPLSLAILSREPGIKPTFSPRLLAI
jgi:uncharacterized protein